MLNYKTKWNYKSILVGVYLYKYKNNYNIIHFWIGLNILFIIVDYYINTIYDMQNEKDYLYHGKKFEHIQGFVILFWKIFGPLLEYGVLNNNVYLWDRLL